MNPTGFQRTMPGASGLKTGQSYGAKRAGVNGDGEGMTTEYAYDPRLKRVVFRVIHDRLANCDYEIHVHHSNAFQVADCHTLEVVAVEMADRATPRTSRSWAEGWYDSATGRLVGVSTLGGPTVLHREVPDDMAMSQGEALPITKRGQEGAA